MFEWKRQHDFCMQKFKPRSCSIHSKMRWKNIDLHMLTVNIEPSDFMYRVLCTVCRVVFERIQCYDISFSCWIFIVFIVCLFHDNFSNHLLHFSTFVFSYFSPVCIRFMGFELLWWHFTTATVSLYVCYWLYFGDRIKYIKQCGKRKGNRFDVDV